MDPSQSIEDEERLPRPLGLNRRSDPLQPPQQPLGQLGGADLVGRGELGNQDTSNLHTNICS